jgi:hypothetical protein
MPKGGGTQTVAHGPGIKVEETREIGSGSAKVNYRQVSENRNTADVISAAMSLKFVNEVFNDGDRRWRWASTDKIQELLKLGRPDENGYLYYHIVREGEEKGIYCVTESQWRALPDKDSMRLHKPSIEEAIKEGRPLAFGVGYDGGRLYDDVARVAQFGTGSEAAVPQVTAISKQLRTTAGKVSTKLPAIKQVLDKELASDIEELVRLASE